MHNHCVVHPYGKIKIMKFEDKLIELESQIMSEGIPIKCKSSFLFVDHISKSG